MTRYALAAAAGIAVVWLIGVAHATELISLPAFDLDREGTVPQAYSGMLLLWAAGAAFAAARLGTEPRRALYALAAVFAFMSLDEVFRIHETIDDALDFDWQVIYLPIVAVAVAGWVRVSRALARERRGRAGWIAGAACWGIAQVLEAFQWDGRVRPGTIHWDQLTDAQIEQKLTEPPYLVKMLPEELLEMCGSLLFALVLSALLARVVMTLDLRRRKRDAVIHGRFVDRSGE
jgi:hypothetical protein